ncbi:hypothetical protein EVAR_75717_1 [Eumeta japonica]|uniref:Uncharacterized protein n=1 Tax=Eumeta variegata TaxID=151549 RepID=A0A4C1W0M9_EUMVA|nr:hypothetical protein EVAR_75717_1 [Eumeta japonica]
MYQHFLASAGSLDLILNLELISFKETPDGRADGYECMETSRAMHPLDLPTGRSVSISPLTIDGLKRALSSDFRGEALSPSRSLGTAGECRYQRDDGVQKQQLSVTTKPALRSKEMVVQFDSS